MVKAKVFMLLFLMILLIGVVAAAEWDNIKSYDEETKTVSIKNLFGLGKTYAEIKLKSDLHVVVPPTYTNVSMFEITSYSDYDNFLSQIKYFNIKNDMKEVDKNVDIKYWGDVIIDDNIRRCISSTHKNGTKYDTGCYNEKVGEHIKKGWVAFTERDIVNGETLTIGLFTNVKHEDKVEWIPEFAGVKVKEWAAWEGDIAAGLVSCWALDETSGIVIDYGLGQINNGTNYGGVIVPSQSSQFGNAYYFAGASENITIPDHASLNFTSNFTLGVVFNTSASNAQLAGKGSFGGAGFGYNLYSSTGNGGTRWVLVADGAWTSLGGNIDTNTGNDVLNINTFYAGVEMRNYINGTLDTTKSSGVGAAATPTVLDFHIGDSVSGDDGAKYISEVWVLNYTATQSDVTDIWNSGTIVSCLAIPNVFPTVTLNSPVDVYNTSTQLITFNVTPSDPTAIQNVTLYLNGTLNETNTSGFNNTIYLFPKTLAEGAGNWTIGVCDDLGDCTNSSRSFLVDLTNPVITNVAPVTSSKVITATVPYDVKFNASIEDNLALHSCWYYNTTDNVSIACGTNASISLGAGQQTLAWSANDSTGAETTEITIFNITQVNTNVSFTDPVAEGVSDEVTFNLTATIIDNLTAILEYNNTNYSMVEEELTAVYGNFTYSIISPLVNAPSEIPLKIYYSLDGFNYSTEDFNQTVNFITPLEVTNTTCTAGLTPAMYFNFSDAQNLTTVENMSIDYNFQMGLNDATTKITAGTFADVTDFYLCINASVSTNYSLSYGEIDYTKTGYSERRWYAFNTQRLTTTLSNNTLYSLIGSSSTSFLITIQDPSLTNLVSKYTTLLRWYPQDDEYKIVEMGVTDGKGQTVKKVEIEDVDYRIGVYEKNGSLIFLATPIRMICIETPCTYTLNVLGTSGVDYDNYLNVEGSLTEAASVVTFTYNDPSQETSLMELEVYRVSGDNSVIVCEDNSTSFTGVLTCDVSAESGLLKAIAFRSASPERAIDTLWIDNKSTVFQGTMGLFIMLILVLLLFLIGIYSPIVALILGLLSLIPALFLGVITYPIMIGVAVLTGIVIHFMKEGASP